MQPILDEVKARSLATKALIDDETFTEILDAVTG